MYCAYINIYDPFAKVRSEMTALSCHYSRNSLNFVNFKTWICSIYFVVLYDIIFIFESLKLTDFFFALHPKPIDFLRGCRVKRKYTSHCPFIKKNMRVAKSAPCSIDMHIWCCRCRRMIIEIFGK